jgi:hypothetical protein
MRWITYLDASGLPKVSVEYSNKPVTLQLHIQHKNEVSVQLQTYLLHYAVTRLSKDLNKAMESSVDTKCMQSWYVILDSGQKRTV